MKFFLGTHVPVWLSRLDVPLFVSRRTLSRYRTPPRARAEWALDSGGFTELAMYGGWTIKPWDYAREVRRYADEVGHLAWAAPQDWMCEPAIRAKTHFTVADHQMLTTHNLLDLRDMAPELPWIPVLQGWELDDYLRHVDRYEANGIDLEAEPLVGVGTVCRRQGTDEVERLLTTLARLGFRLHAFGAKAQGLARCHHLLESADSLAWSYAGRRDEPMKGHTHKSCANCAEYALAWRERLLANMVKPRQLLLV